MCACAQRGSRPPNTETVAGHIDPLTQCICSKRASAKGGANHNNQRVPNAKIAQNNDHVVSNGRCVTGVQLLCKQRYAPSMHVVSAIFVLQLFMSHFFARASSLRHILPIAIRACARSAGCRTKLCPPTASAGGTSACAYVIAAAGKVFGMICQRCKSKCQFAS